MSDSDCDYFTAADLQKRWRKKNIKTIYRYVKSYNDILKPIKMGRDLLFSVDNVEKFEKQMRVIK